MAIHFSVLAWRILWTEEPGRLHTMVKSRPQLKQIDTHVPLWIILILVMESWRAYVTWELGDLLGILALQSIS